MNSVLFSSNCLFLIRTHSILLKNIHPCLQSDHSIITDGVGLLDSDVVVTPQSEAPGSVLASNLSPLEEELETAEWSSHSLAEHPGAEANIPPQNGSKLGALNRKMFNLGSTGNFLIWSAISAQGANFYSESKEGYFSLPGRLLDQSCLLDADVDLFAPETHESQDS